MSEKTKYILYVVVILYMLNPVFLFCAGIIYVTSVYTTYYFLICLIIALMYYRLWILLRRKLRYYDNIYYWKMVRPFDKVIVERYRRYGRRKNDRVI